jgi:hypothetical protein
MIETPGPTRPSLLARIVALFAGALMLIGVAVIVAAAPASAVDCLDCPGGGGGGGGGTNMYSAQLTVTRPTAGVVTSSPAGLNCPASGGGSCTITDSQITSDSAWPTTGWPTYTLTWSGGGSGYAPGWSGACTGSVCSVVNDGDKTVTVTPYDNAAPQLVGVQVPQRVGPSTPMTASATDNSGSVAGYRWFVCAGDVSTCSAQRSSQSSSITLGELSPGAYTVSVSAIDAASNLSSTLTAHTTLAVAPVLTVSQTPAATPQLALTFSTDDTYVSAANRQCRAYLGDTAPGSEPAFSACTTPTTYAPTLADGSYAVDIKATNDVGQTAQAHRQVIVDATAPTVAFVSGPAEGAIVNATSTHFGFEVTDANPGAATCSIDSGAATSCTDGVDLADVANGTHSVLVNATDRAGNAATATRHVIVEIPTAVHTTQIVSTYGRAAMLTATVTPVAATGTMRFRTSAGVTLCTATISKGVASCAGPDTLPAGTRTITATYTGSYSGSSSYATLVVRRAATGLHAAANRASVHKGKSVTVTASRLPSTATGTVTVLRGRHALCHAAVRHGRARCSLLATLNPGHYSLTVMYGGNGNYLASTGTVHITVTK